MAFITRNAESRLFGSKIFVTDTLSRLQSAHSLTAKRMKLCPGRSCKTVICCSQLPGQSAEQPLFGNQTYRRTRTKQLRSFEARARFSCIPFSFLPFIQLRLRGRLQAK